MNLFDERVIPVIDKLKLYFDIPDYEEHGYNSNGIYGLEVVEEEIDNISGCTSEQITVFCNIYPEHAMVMCREREKSMFIQLGFDKNLIHIDYDFRTDDYSTVKNIDTDPTFEGIVLTPEQIQYCKDLYQYLQEKRLQYEEQNGPFTEDYFD